MPEFTLPAFLYLLKEMLGRNKAKLIDQDFLSGNGITMEGLANGPVLSSCGRRVSLMDYLNVLRLYYKK